MFKSKMFKYIYQGQALRYHIAEERHLGWGSACGKLQRKDDSNDLFDKPPTGIEVCKLCNRILHGGIINESMNS